MSEWLPTYDIDEAYSFKYKTKTRTTGGIIKDFFKGNLQRIAHRKKVINHHAPDPFDAYEWMDHLHQQYQLHPKYFFWWQIKMADMIKIYYPTSPPFKINKTTFRKIFNRYSSFVAIGR
jgi:hypothetical protein